MIDSTNVTILVNKGSLINVNIVTNPFRQHGNLTSTKKLTVIKDSTYASIVVKSFPLKVAAKYMNEFTQAKNLTSASTVIRLFPKLDPV